MPSEKTVRRGTRQSRRFAPLPAALLFERGDAPMNDNDEIHLRVTYASNLDHGRGILCPNAKGYSSGAGMCADWRHHHAWNANPQKRPTRGLAASLFLAERYGLLVGKGFAGAVPAEVRSVTAHRRHCCDCTNVPCGAAPRTRGSLMAVPNFTQR